MFTGIIEELGAVVDLQRAGDSARLTVRGPRVTADARHGDSIAVNGVCLTVVDDSFTDDDFTDDDVTDGSFTADVMAETLERTSLGTATPGSTVNLERATPAGGRLGGHVVQGHVDGVGEIARIEPGERWHSVRIALPAELAPYVAEKGSIAVDGISLTVTGVSPAEAEEHWFSVGLIPTTLAATTLGTARVGDRVNLEVDVIAKYLARLAGFDNSEPSGGGDR